MSTPTPPPPSLLASAHNDDTITVWDAARQRDCFHIKTGTVHSVKFSHDGSRLVAALHSGALCIYEIYSDAHCDDSGCYTEPNSRQIARLFGHSGPVFCACFVPFEHHMLVSGGADSTVRIWKIADYYTSTCANFDHKMLRGHEEGSVVWAVACDASRRVVVSAASDGTIRTWDLVTGDALNVLRGHTNSVTDLAFVNTTCNNLPLLASAGCDGTVRLWVPALGKEVATLSVPGGEEAHCVAVAPTLVDDDDDDDSVSTTVIAAGDADGGITLWRLGSSGGVLQTTYVHYRDQDDIPMVESVSFSRDGKILASCTSTGNVTLWSVDLEKLTLSLCCDLKEETPPDDADAIARGACAVDFSS